MFEKKNAKDNFTTFYKQVYGQFPSCVLRRGSRFRLGIRFNQEVELDNLDVKVNLALGEHCIDICSNILYPCGDRLKPGKETS